MFEIFWKKIYYIFSWFTYRHRYIRHMNINNDENEYRELPDNAKLKIKIPKYEFIKVED